MSLMVLLIQLVRVKIYDYKGLVKCTDHALADFVQFFYANGLQHTTDLVILGDHNPQ